MLPDPDEPHPQYVLMVPPPRFMTDEQLRAHFGFSERAMRRLRMLDEFPKRNWLLNRTDSKLVDFFFDRMSGLTGEFFQDDGEEFLSGDYAGRGKARPAKERY